MYGDDFYDAFRRELWELLRTLHVSEPLLGISIRHAVENARDNDPGEMMEKLMKVRKSDRPPTSEEMCKILGGDFPMQLVDRART